MKQLIKLPLTMVSLGALLGLAYGEDAPSDSPNPPRSAAEIMEQQLRQQGNRKNPEKLDAQTIKTFDQMMKAINDYVRKHLPNREVKSRYLTLDEEPYILELGTFDEKHDMILVYFDLTDVINQINKSSDEESKKKLAEFLEVFKSDQESLKSDR